MNDPGEIEYAWQIYKDAMRKYTKADLFEPLVKWIDGVLKVQDFFILSLSKQKDSLSLWNRYGQGYGYSLEIIIKQLVEEIKKNKLGPAFKGFFDVSYEENFNHKYVESLTGEYYKAQTVNRNFPINSEQTADITSKVLSSLLAFKHNAYTDEKEVRGIFILPNLHSLVTDSIWLDSVFFRIQDTKIIPFITLKMQDRKWINGVILGPLNKEKRYAEGIELLLKSKRSTIGVAQSEVPYR